ncbi:MAG: hypothetical protein GX549_08660 [Clostridiales bacterium]|nr:hypothetical protein [Clostridiales bacterium]
MNILAIGCHPDDVEIGCGGTLRKYADRGDRVFLCHVANGDMGHTQIMPPELRLIRGEEARRGGAILGAQVISLDIGDLRVKEFYDRKIEELVKVIRDTKPDVIITHSPTDYMVDHVSVGQMSVDASFSATVPHYAPGSPAHGVFPVIYYMDNLAGVNFLPTEYVDITDTIEAKIAALECHESQIKWMREHDHIDFSEFVRVTARFRGIQSSVGYAEGFTQHMSWPRIATRRMLP